MKKTLLIFITLSVMQTIATAQVDLSVLKGKNTIWLYDAAIKKNDYWDGFALMKNGKAVQYTGGQKPNKETGMGTNIHLRKAHLCFDLMSMWCNDYHFEGKKIVSARSSYYWNITKLTENEMILQRGKMIEPNGVDTYFDESNIRTYKLKRLTKTQKKYPYWFRDSGSGEADYLRENKGTNDPFSETIDF